MGRITVFTSQDINSKQLLKCLESRNLPYKEISLTDHPSRIKDLQALELGPIVPQVYFNSRGVGGLERCLKEMKRWDRSSRFDTPLAKYEAEVAALNDPEDMRLSLDSMGYKLVDTPPAPIQPHIVVKLPDGRAAPLREATELLKEAIPKMDEHKYKGTTYKYCFSGVDLVEALMHNLEIKRNLALRFIDRLLQAHVLHHVDQEMFPHDTGAFQETTTDFYRLQCYDTLDILNSYRLWPDHRRDCVQVVEDLMKRLNDIEMQALDAEGLLDFHLARDCPGYPIFEDAVCELQAFDMNDIAALDTLAKTAFCLNVWWVMWRYGFLKSGIPLNPDDRKHFKNNVKFYLGTNLFTMQEWVDVLRGKPKEKMLKGIRKDPRVLMAAFMGPHNGSSWSSPFSRFSARNLEEELHCAACAFCSEERNFCKSKDGKFKITALIRNYKAEFANSDKNLLALMAKHVSQKAAEELEPFIKGKEKIYIEYREPELGFHASVGPWYNQKGIQILHDAEHKRERNDKGGSGDSLGGGGGGSNHSHSSKGSKNSQYSWL